MERFELQTSDVRRQRNFACQLVERREPESSEEEPNPRRTYSLQHGCFYSGRIVRQARGEFRPHKSSRYRGFESPSLRHPVLTSGDSERGSPEIRAQRAQFASLAAPETREFEPHGEDFVILSLLRISLVPREKGAQSNGSDAKDRLNRSRAPHSVWSTRAEYRYRG